MARHKLTDSKVRSLAVAGIYGDGDGLYLRVQKSGTRSWVFVWRRYGVRREIGLGSYGAGAGQVSLATARIKAEEARAIVGAGGDPKRDMAERKAAGTSFGTIADEYIATMKPKWSGKTLAAWERFARTYAKPLRGIPIDRVSTDDVVRCLRPMWETKHQTALQSIDKLRLVLDHGKARGLRSGDNPAQWRGLLDQILPSLKSKQRQNHAAMPYPEIPALVKGLRERTDSAARAIEFLILTAARNAEARGATWDEIDLHAALWTIPAERMKAGKEHRVPLPSRAVAILEEMHETRIGSYVFYGRFDNRPLADMTLAKTLRAAGAGDFTIHGFRSSFRDWAGDATSFPREVAEAALAHSVGDLVERAYRRGDALEKRRKLMEAWAQYCSATTGGNVVRMRKGS